MSENMKKIDLAVRGALWLGPVKAQGKAGKPRKGGQLVDVFVAKGKVVAPMVPAAAWISRGQGD
jgi:hypothetical protein